MTDLPSLSHFSYQVLILITALVSKSIISHFMIHEPLSFFQFYCTKLSDKVNKSSNSPQQRTIAGLIAIVVTLAPIIIMLWLFAAFIAVDFLWQLTLVYCSIGSLGLSKINTTIAQALVAKQNYLAKQTLQPWLLRATEPLSSLGLSKAAIEMKLLRTLQQGYGVAVIFLIAGPLAALSFRLLLEMHYCWNTKLEKFTHFGHYSKSLVDILLWLPVRIFALLILFTCLGKNFLLFWRLSKKHFFELNSNMALLLLALSLEVKLGGVAMYANTFSGRSKLRKLSVNDLARQPQVTDIIHGNNKVNYLVGFSLVFIVLIAVAVEFISANI